MCVHVLLSYARLLPCVEETDHWKHQGRSGNTAEMTVDIHRRRYKIPLAMQCQEPNAITSQANDNRYSHQRPIPRTQRTRTMLTSQRAQAWCPPCLHAPQLSATTAAGPEGGQNNVPDP
ncbi:uncharacterized protein LOC143283123 isoform X4 [Babylonia areolata]|uniref:uncharacterized protein LOC143283123 isoform X4 n=1 Tax=Babylonia areolata TaxID=304850 RepID=UPI003FD40A3C